uniref:Bromo domain-containing protein n=1 Tax=Cuerna arida TaxID=1464854 RepID=A0A1B6GTD1_9HEMI
MIRVKMEEDEETTSPKKQRRKRKLRKDFSPEPSPPDSEEESEEGEEKKRRRGRRKKKKESPPEPEKELTDLQQVYKIVEHLIASSGAAAFLERPDDSMFGMSDYYEIITKPMWLKEVERKYEAEEYTTATEVAADVRLMLENCYHYWGPCDTLSKRALKLEQVFENKIAGLPENVQKLCSLEATHGDIVKEEPDDSSPKKSNSKKGGYVSKLLNWVMSGKGRSDDKPASTQETLNKARRAEREAAEKQLAQWENDNLLTPTVKDQIASMWEFPVIGQFLHLVYNVLNIDPISHLELERMLLMPQASNTLATLITSMLIPPLFRAKLEVGPAMPYSVWTERLSTKVTSWYRNYHSKGDSTVEVFDSLGIEPQFWLVMGDENPLKDYQFHELTFLQRVWLLKGLCDFLLHNHKTIQDCINNLEMEELREQNLGRDKEGYSYHYFPMFTEVRIYKMAKVPDTKKDYGAGVEEAITMCAEEEDDEEQAQESNLIGFSRRPLHKPPRSMRPSHSDFRLVCQSLEDVRCLVDQFCDADPLLLKGEGINAPLVSGLQSIVSQLESRESKMELAVFNVRNRMRDEWQQHKARGPDYVDPGVTYWERKKEEEKRAVEEKPPDLSIPGTSSDGLLIDDEKRERRSRRESSLKMLAREENGAMGDESAEESPLDFDDDSEDEWFATKKDKENKKKKRCMSAKKMKKLADITDKFQHTSKDKDVDKLNLSSLGSGFQSSTSVKVGNISSSSPEQPVKIKQELPDPDDAASQLKTVSTKTQKPVETPKIFVKDNSKMKKTPPVICKQEIIEETQHTTSTTPPNNNVIQTLVPPVNVSNVKLEKASKPSPITPDLSRLKRSNSPDADVVYISDSEDPPDIKPNPAMLVQQMNTNKEETINYSMSVPQQPMGNYLVPGTPTNQGQFVPVNVAPGEQVFNAQSQVFNVAQQPTQPITYQMPTTPTLVQQIRPNPTIVRLQAPRPNLAPNQKFLVIQGNTNNVNQPNQFINKGPRAQGNSFPTTPTMQSVNWFGPRGSPQANVNYSPRHRGQSMVVGQGQSPRGRGSPRSPLTPTRGSPRFSGRTPTNIRTPPSTVRTPTQVGARTPSPIRGRGGPVAPGVRAGPVRNLNFNRSPVKPVSKPVNDIAPRNNSPDIEGTLMVSLTDSGGFGYVVLLPDGGKISLTQDQLAKIRSDNGGTLPKTCKVPLNMQTEGFRID